jgi:thiamine-phosphate pyrophosphorylase
MSAKSSPKSRRQTHNQLGVASHWELATALLLFYYITDRSQFSGEESQRRSRLLEKISEAALAGIDYIQLREKDLSARALESLAQAALQRIREKSSRTRLLINSRTDVAIAVGADGVHLPSADISPAEAREIWRKTQSPPHPIIGVSCHTETEVIRAQNGGADFVVFGPIFGKKGATGTTRGLAELRKVSRHKIPVLALGGVTLENADSSIAAGTSGIAAIRLFQENEIAGVVKKLGVR